jgi:hypothetical protein
MPWWIRGAWRSLNFTELTEAATALWGPDWRGEFFRLSGLCNRTLNRWRAQGVVNRPLITSMMDALLKLRENGLPLP